jgi:hypothetical protein
MSLLGRAVAVAVPALLLAACGDATSSPTGTDDATTSPSSASTAGPSDSSTATPTATPSQDRPSVLTIEGLAHGAPPAVPYVYADPATGAWSLVRPGGQSQPLEGPVSAFAPIGNGLVVSTYGGVDATVKVLDDDLERVGGGEVRDGALAVTPNGSIAGWLGSDGTPHVVEAGGTRQLDLPQVRGGNSIAALISDGATCKEGEGGNGCAAFVNSVDGTRAWSAVSHGLVDRVPGVISVGDVADGGRMVAMTSIEDEGSCWGMFEVWEPKPLWQTCEHTLFDFSPSGERILAGPAYLDGFGQGIAAVLDGTGKVLAEWHSRGHAAILHTIWEDDDHVLVIVFENEQWAVLRLGVDEGSVEIAVPPVPDNGGEGAFVLPTR